MLQVQTKVLGTFAIVSLQGQIVNGETEILRDAVRALSTVGAIKIDLARLTTIDAHGLGVMLELREQVKARGIRFELMNVTKWVSRVLELSRLDSVFAITSGVEVLPTASRNRQAGLAAPRAAFGSCA